MRIIKKFILWLNNVNPVIMNIPGGLENYYVACMSMLETCLDQISACILVGTRKEIMYGIERMIALSGSLGKYDALKDLMDTFMFAYKRSDIITSTRFEMERGYFSSTIKCATEGKELESEAENLRRQILDMSIPMKDVLPYIVEFIQTNWEKLYKSNYTYRVLEVACRYMDYMGSMSQLRRKLKKAYSNFEKKITD